MTDLQQLFRRLVTLLDDANVPFMVISKLEWSALAGGSERQRRDVVGVLQTADADIDLPYIERWVAELRLTSEWEVAKRTA